MLKQRVITSLILAPLLIAAVLFAPGWVIESVLALVLLLAAHEWAKLARLGNFAGVFYAAIMLLVAWFGNRYAMHIHLYTWIYWVSAAWWLTAVLWLIAAERRRNLIDVSLPAKLLIGFVVLLPMWCAFVELFERDERGVEFALFIIMIVWLADIGAYFAGRRFGRIKLAPMISPGKTLEGVAGGLLAVAAFAVVGGVYFNLAGQQLLLFSAISAVCALISVVGDLFESLLKRQAGVKDSGNIMPGHGGVLDRIDSMTAAVPLFVFTYHLLIS